MSIAPIQNLSFNSLSSTPSSNKEWVKKIAIRTFAELAVSLVFATTVCFFVATPVGVATVFSVVAIQTAVHLILRLAMREAPLIEEITALSFGICSGSNFQTVTHEVGHTLAARALYGSGRFEVIPFGGGMTNYNPRHLTKWGNRIGRTASEFCVVAGGPRLALMTSGAILALGLIIRKKHPVLAKYFIAYAALDFLSHAEYAASTFYSPKDNLSHDFVHLSKLGFSPILATIGIAAFPILLAINLSILRKEPRVPVLTPAS